MIRRTSRFRCLVLAAASFLSLDAVTGEGDAAATVAEMKDLLAQYDRAGGGNTIPIEQAIIRLRDLRAGKELVPFLAHKRFGFAAAWALSELGDATLADSVLDAFKGRDTAGKAEWALFAGAFRTDAMRAALRELANSADANPQDKAAARAALLRAGDPAIEKELLEALKGKDVKAIAGALLTIGASRRADLLVKVTAFAKDERAVEGGLKSGFGVQTVKRLANGGQSSTTSYPALATLADVAVEAASRLVSPTTPDMMAWWYETETGPRFPISTEGKAFLAAYGEAAAKAAAAKGLSPGEAVAAVLRHVRGAPGGEEMKVRICSVAFAGGWTIGYKPEGFGAGESEAVRNVSVDGAGKVTAK